MTRPESDPDNSSRLKALALRLQALGADFDEKTPVPSRLARSILDATRQKTPPVDLKRVLGLWPELNVNMEELDGPGYLLDLGPTGGEILLRAQDRLPRRRYTLAHEIGHWVRGTTCAARMPIGDGENPQSGGTSLNSRARLERWCDEFAACLLLPDAWVRDELLGVASEGLPELLLKMPTEYLVSQRAAWIRAAEVAPLAILHWRPGTNTEILGEFSSPDMVPRHRAALVRWALLQRSTATRAPMTVTIENMQIFTTRVGARSFLSCAVARSSAPRAPGAPRVSGPSLNR